MTFSDRQNLFDAEDHVLAKFTRVTYASPYDKLNADICLTLYDREGNALRTWEKTLCSLEAETPAADNSAESFDISEELSGQLTEGPLPEGLDFRDRIYISGSSSYYLIDMDGNLVRWGRNWDQYDMGWDENTLQPYSQRNILVPHAKKMAMGYNATLVLDEASVLWGWGSVPWLLLKETPPESNHPEKIMLAVKDIAAGDFYAAAVMEDGTLTVWGRQEGFREPVAIRENVEKVYVLWDTLIFIDDDGNLYGYKDAWSGEMGGLLEEPLLLDTDVEDIQRLNFDLESLLVLKKDGTMGMTDYYAEPYTFLPLAQDVRQINGSGFISSVGDYWQIFIDERTGEYVGMESMKDTAYAVYNAGEESIQIMKNGEILVRLQL